MFLRNGKRLPEMPSSHMMPTYGIRIVNKENPGMNTCFALMHLGATILAAIRDVMDEPTKVGAGVHPLDATIMYFYVNTAKDQRAVVDLKEIEVAGVRYSLGVGQDLYRGPESFHA